MFIAFLTLMNNIDRGGGPPEQVRNTGSKRFRFACSGKSGDEQASGAQLDQKNLSV